MKAWFDGGVTIKNVKGLLRLWPLITIISIFVVCDKWSPIHLSLTSLIDFARILVLTVSWIGILSLPALVMGRCARFFYVFLFLVGIPILLLRLFTLKNYGFLIGGEFVDIVLSSSPEEISSFFRQLMSLNLFLQALGALSAVLFVLWLVWRYDYQRVNRHGVIVALLIIVFFTLFNPWFRRNPKRIFSTLGCSLFIEQVADRAAFYLVDTQDDADIAVHTEFEPASSPLVVFVIGESAMRNRWSLYGYQRQTTKCLDDIKDELIVFSDVVGSSHTTAQSLEFLLTESTQEVSSRRRISLCQILSAGGYKCSLFSAQSRWGEVNGMESICFRTCSEKRFMRECLDEECLDGKWPDEKLLFYLDRKLIGLREEPMAVFLHLYGSHFPPSSCYPMDRAKYTPEPIENYVETTNPQNVKNHYDNSIAFTDWILGEVICRLRKVDRPTALFYISDHGESVDSTNWRDLSDMSVWELPMVCWFSPSFREAFPHTVAEIEQAKDRPLQSERLLPGLVSLCQVRGYGIPEEDFHGDSYKVKPRMILQRQGRVEYIRRKPNF